MAKTSLACKAQCSNCSLHEICMPAGLQESDFQNFGLVIKQSRRVKKGEYLFHSGEPFSSLYAIRTGFFKTTVNLQDGRDQVTGFFMSGELVGMDGISINKYICDAVALEDSEVCELPFDKLEELQKYAPHITLHFFRLMSREIVRDQSVMLLLGNMRAEERLAVFLMNLSDRLSMRGFAAYDFILRMSREEIGSYLGLKLETVSRTLSRFNQEGLISVEHRHIKILQPEALQKIVSSSDGRKFL
ncbi:fumarate/nitrate reduction transcriptional regulator Fnr [Kingella negevensis]|uniref:fumarate/nitrate reduction transcriptional regulator Fnr n=1 Tax=Kingella negevensis TaxID=1522312 RepID=UPI00254E8FA3|nr:fumarate/nitrate reduction transcriptional regulator Fnr [Kingella negevensis]MDK4681110.1 fumarate/nitrate reduction transcriptional regulator Fnr [Kingella negevensis]MDK4683312.1 fumarate/nitrate reduction transcriptional regulator Fnr [Kingella negevensis]MDK4691556.1 fumarate/nitrate reduction transcriptional regulator Fnr [Kingella negevensis]MDK4693293.1 fumarate/nitrate reduction transcriptional regulator Fnr [Kingella negevensis]MDK4699593.1 fumarate/nitrate reduction transcription